MVSITREPEVRETNIRGHEQMMWLSEGGWSSATSEKVGPAYGLV